MTDLHPEALSEACDAWEWVASARLTEAGRMAVAAAISAYLMTLVGTPWRPPYYPGQVPEERVAEIMRKLGEGPIA